MAKKKKHLLKVAKEYKEVAGFKISKTRTIINEKSVESFIANNKKQIQAFIERQEERMSVLLPKKISNVPRYVRNYLRSYRSFEEFVKKAAAPVDWREANHAYEMLELTGRIQDLQAEVNEKIEVERIHYSGNNYYEYVGKSRKCKFQIKYSDLGGNSQVAVEVYEGEDI